MVHVMWVQSRAVPLVLERGAEVELGCKTCPPSRGTLVALGRITGIAVISAFC